MSVNVSMSEECWRTALWILDALAPSKRSSADDSTALRRRKIADGLKKVVSSPPPIARDLHDNVIPGAPFLFGLLWWAERREIKSETLNQWHTMRNAAGFTLETAFGGPNAAYAALRAFARSRVTAPDRAFSEREIRTALIEKLINAANTV